MGLLRDYLAHQRAQAQQQAAAQQVAGLLGTPGTEEQPGTGLLANYQDPRARIQFAGGLMGVPGMEQAGANLLNQVFQRQQQQGQFDIQEARRQDEFERTFRENQRQFGLNFSQGAQEFDRTLQQRQDEFAQEMSAKRRKEEEDLFLKLSQGGVPNMSMSDRKTLHDMNLVNQQLYTGARRADALAKRLERYGTETVDALSDNRASEMRIMRENVINDLKTAWEMGVLQKDEYERLEKTLPETDALIKGWTSADTTLAAPYRAVAKYLNMRFQSRINIQKQLGLPGIKLRQEF